jgi:hypothetical protein
MPNRDTTQGRKLFCDDDAVTQDKTHQPVRGRVDLDIADYK